MGIGDKKPIWVSEESLRLIKEMQDKAAKQLGIRPSQDDVIRLALDKPTIIVFSKEENNKKKVKSIFGDNILGMPVHMTDFKIDGDGNK